MVTVSSAVGARLRLKWKVNLPQLHAEPLKHLSEDGIICKFQKSLSDCTRGVAIAQMIRGPRQGKGRERGDVKQLFRSCDDSDQSSILCFQKITVGQLRAPRQEYRQFCAVLENRVETTLLTHFKRQRKGTNSRQFVNISNGVFFDSEHQLESLKSKTGRRGFFCIRTLIIRWFCFQGF